MSLKEGPGKPIEDPVMLEILDELEFGKDGAKERLYKYIIEDTKRTGTFYSHWFFESLGLEYPNAYSIAIAEWEKQKAIEYAEKKKIEEKLRKEKVDKITKLLMGISIIILIVMLVIVCISK